MDDELAVAAEQLGERLLAARAVEGISLFDPDPRQRAALGADQIAHPGQRLFVLQVCLARGEPLLMGDDFRRLHGLAPSKSATRSQALATSALSRFRLCAQPFSMPSSMRPPAGTRATAFSRTVTLVF